MGKIGRHEKRPLDQSTLSLTFQNKTKWIAWYRTEYNMHNAYIINWFLYFYLPILGNRQ